MITLASVLWPLFEYNNVSPTWKRDFVSSFLVLLLGARVERLMSLSGWCSREEQWQWSLVVQKVQPTMRVQRECNENPSFMDISGKLDERCAMILWNCLLSKKKMDSCKIVVMPMLSSLFNWLANAVMLSIFFCKFGNYNIFQTRWVCTTLELSFQHHFTVPIPEAWLVEPPIVATVWECIGIILLTNMHLLLHTWTLALWSQMTEVASLPKRTAALSSVVRPVFTMVLNPRWRWSWDIWHAGQSQQCL